MSQMTGTYKYMLQGKFEDGPWFDVFSFYPDRPLEEIQQEHKELHPRWKIRIIPNPKWKGGKDYSKLTYGLINGI